MHHKLASFDLGSPRGASPPRHRAPSPICGAHSARQSAAGCRVAKGTSAALAPRQREPTPAPEAVETAQSTCHMNGSSTGEPPGTGTGSVGTPPCSLALAHLAAVRGPCPKRQ
jgi:hypothetical protein